MNKISVFYHVFQAEGWEFLYQNQIHRLHASGLHGQIESIKICVSGEKELPYVPKKAEVIRNEDSSSEASTLRRAWEFSKNCVGTNNILYMHTKGVYNKSIQTDAWRLYMEYFLIDRWHECLAILKEHPCCGVQFHRNYHFPHFSGNMWWATSDHIASLNDNQLQSRAGCEFWICSSFSAGTDKPYCMHMPPDGMNLYHSIIQPKHYMD